VNLVDKYDAMAEHYSDADYADAERYYARRAKLVIEHGPPLQTGSVVLDIACGDGGLGRQLLERGIEYQGVDASEGMVDVARRELGERVVVGDFGFEPSRPVDATTIFRALVLVPDRGSFFERVRSFTKKKLLFDFDPRLRDPGALDGRALRRELSAAGWKDIRMRPFLLPQRATFPPSMQRLLYALEPLPGARVVTRIRFPVFVSASA